MHKVKIDDPQLPVGNAVLVARALYYRYSSWLLGYLLEVLKDHRLAEQYLVEIFKEVPARLTDLHEHPWIGLKALAKAKLLGHFNGLRIKDMVDDLSNTGDRLKFDSFISTMSTEQQIVFCGVYYYQRSTQNLAEEMGITDQEVKRILKEAFVMIKNG